MELRKKKTAEDIRRRQGIDSFVKSLGTKAVDYGKGRLRDYPKEVASGWKTALGLKKKVVPESLEGMAPLAESVGGFAVTPLKALQQLGQSAVKINKAESLVRGYKTKIKPSGVRAAASDLRRLPEDVLGPITEVGFTDKLGKGVHGQNVRYSGGTSKIDFAPGMKKSTPFHEVTHVTAHAKRGKKSQQGYYSDVLETASKKGADIVKKAKKKGSFYQDMPIEMHARRVPELLRSLPDQKGKITQKTYNVVFNTAAKDTISKLKKEAPTLYKKTLKDVAKSYKKEAAFKRYVKEGIQEGRPPGTFNEWFEGLKTSPKSKATKTKPGLPMKTDDIIKLIKKLPKGEVKKIKIKRKAD